MISTIFKYLPLIFGFAKGFVDNAKHEYKIKTYNETKDKIHTIEHLITKLEKKIGETRREIDDLRKQIMLSRLINFTLSALIIFLIIFMK